MPHEVSASRTTNPIPDQRSVEQELAPRGRNRPDPEHEEPGGSVRPVPFDRLLSVAVLTPAQASVLAVQLLDAAHVDGTHGAVPAVGAVTLTSAGAVDVGRPDASGGTPVTELMRGLVHNARRLPAHPTPEQLALLRRLERLADDELPDTPARARDLEAAIADTLGPRAQQRLSRQLAALVEAFAHVAPGVPAPVDAAPAGESPSSTTPPPPDEGRGSAVAGPSARLSHRAARTRHGTDRRPPRRTAALPPRPRSRRVVVLGVALAVLVGVAGYALLSKPGGDTVASPGRGQHAGGQGTHRRAQQSDQGANHATEHRAPVVPTLAHRHAGAITGVALQRTGSCAAGAFCPVKVTVHFRPTSTSQPVTWRVGTAHVCKRGITWSAPVTVMAQPGWTTVYASSSVRLPRGRPLALTALTTTPAHVQSPPVPVAGSFPRC